METGRYLCFRKRERDGGALLDEDNFVAPPVRFGLLTRSVPAGYETLITAVTMPYDYSIPTQGIDQPR